MERQAVAKVQKTPARVNHLKQQSALSSATGRPLLELQRSIGNQAVQRLVSSPYIQTKLQVSTPGDPFEQEADRVADTVMRMPDPVISQQHTAIGIQTKPLASQITQLIHQEVARQPAEEEEEVVATKPLLQLAPLAAREDEEEEEKVARNIETNPVPQEEEQKKKIAPKPISDAPIQRQSKDEDKEEESLSVAPAIQRQMEEREDEKIAAKLFRQVTSNPVISLSPQRFSAYSSLSVSRLPTVPIQRLCTECENEVQRKTEPEDNESMVGQDESDLTSTLQRQATSTGASNRTNSISSSSVESHIASSRGAGSPLSPSSIVFFEPRFGSDFSAVRVHTDSSAANAARQLSAQAFTTGSDIFFGTGQYQPETAQGQRLLAHELTHVVQQSAGRTVQRLPDSQHIAIHRGVDERDIKTEEETAPPVMGEEEEVPVAANAAHEDPDTGEEENQVAAKLNPNPSPQEEDKEEAAVATKPTVQRSMPLTVRKDDEEEEKLAAKLESTPSPPEEEQEKTVATKLTKDVPLQRQARKDEEEEETLQTASPIQRRTEEENEEQIQTKSLRAQLAQAPVRSQVSGSATHGATHRLCPECEEEKQHGVAQPVGMLQRKTAPDFYFNQGPLVQRTLVPDVQKKDETSKYQLIYTFKDEIVFLDFDLKERAFTTVTSTPDAAKLIKQGMDKVLHFGGGEPVYETPTFLKTDRVKKLIEADIEAWSGAGVPVMNQLDQLISKRSKALHSTTFIEKVNIHLKTVHAIDPSFIDWNLLIPQLKLNVLTWAPKDSLEASEYDQYEWVLDLLADEARGFEPVAGAWSFDPATINNHLYPFIVNNDALFSHEIINEHSEKFVMPWLVKISQVKYVPDNFSIKVFEPGEDIKKSARTREKLLSEFIQNEVPDLMFKFVLDTWTASGVNPDIWLKQLNIDSYKASLLEHLSETFLQKAKQDPEYIKALRLEAVEKTKFTIIKLFYATALNMQTSNAGLEKQFRKGYKEHLGKGLVAIIEDPANYFELSQKIASATTSFLNSIQPDRTILNDVLVSAMNMLKAMQVPDELSALVVFFTTIGNYLKDFKAGVDEERAKLKEAIEARINVDYEGIAKVVKNWQKVAEEFMEKQFKPMLKKVALEFLAANKKEIENILANYDAANAKYAQQMNESALELEYIAEGLFSDEYEEVEYAGEIVTKKDLPHLKTTIQFFRDEANARLSTKNAEKEKGKLREALDAYDETKQDVINDEFDWLDYVEPIFIEARRRLGISEFPKYTTYRDVFTGRVVAEKNPFLAMVIENYYWKEDIERGMWQAFKVVGLGILTIGAMFVPGVGGLVLGAIDIGVGIGMGVQGVIDAKEVLRMAKLDIHGTIRGVSVEQAEEALKHAWFGLILSVALTAGPVAVSRALKVRGRGGVMLSKETRAWERTLSKETRNALKTNPALRKLYSEMDEGVRAILTLCDSPCIPLGFGPKPAEITRIKDFMKQVKVPPNHPGLREYLHHPSRRTNLTQAMDDLHGVKNMSQLEARLERAVAANVKQAGASANKVGGVWHYKRPDGTVVKEYEIARHGDLAGDRGTSRFFQSHHGIQDAWAINKGIPGYARDDCPAILLRDSKMGTPHQIISARQSGRFDTISSRTYAQERELLKADMKAAGVSSAKASQILQESDVYFGKLYKQIKAKGNTAELTRIFGTWKP